MALQNSKVIYNVKNESNSLIILYSYYDIDIPPWKTFNNNMILKTTFDGNNVSLCTTVFDDLKSLIITMVCLFIDSYFYFVSFWHFGIKFEHYKSSMIMQLAQVLWLLFI